MSSRIPRTIPGLLGLLGLVSGCASREAPLRPDTGDDALVDADATDAGKLPPGAKEALAANHRVFCQSYAACFPAYFTNLFGDVETCVSRRLAASMAALFGPGSALTTDDIVLCGKGYGTAIACDEILRLFYENPVVPADCRLRGSLPNGSVCAGSDQCKSGACRTATGTTTGCGVCQDRVALGGACTLHVDCAEGLACHRTKCTAFVERGGACDDLSPCHVADVCVGGKCEARKKLGASCSVAAQDCDYTTWCNDTTGTCTPLQSGKLGGNCGELSTGGYALCDFGLKCKGGTTGVCVDAAKLGGACFKAGPTGSQCESPLLCTGTCVQPDTDICR